jgi:hypothetical protein
LAVCGITFFLHRGEESIWTNGGVQHCAFLWLLLRKAGHRVIAINGGDGDSDKPPSMLAALGIEFVRFHDVADDIDVLIECGAQVSAEEVERVHRHGGKAVAFKYGNAYVIDTERVIHGKPAGSIFNGGRFDEVWTNPQHVDTCASYWETMYRCPVRVLPHIWDPCFVNATLAQFPPGLVFGYQPGRAKKRVATFEPNSNIVKSCTIPMLVCENAYRRRPELLGDVYITNAEKLKGHLTFQRFAGALDIVKDGLCSFEARYNTPWFLAKHADAVVSHQWENGLNYAYYDALYGGYPLVHNSPMVPVGYRYHGFDAQGGADALIDALEHHDANGHDYCRAAARFLDTVRATAPANVDAHDRALTSLLAA